MNLLFVLHEQCVDRCPLLGFSMTYCRSHIRELRRAPFLVGYFVPQITRMYLFRRFYFVWLRHSSAAEK
jgi:hypothetical protein